MSARIACCVWLLLPLNLAAQAPRIDALGDPLPDGAVARLGTVRLRHHHGLWIQTMTFSPDSRLLASSTDSEGSVRLWDANTGQLRRELQTSNRAIPTRLSFSADGSLLAAGTQGHNDSLFVWEVATGRQTRAIACPTGEPLAICFADGNKTLLSVGNDGRVSWWDVATGKRLRTWDASAEWRKPGSERSWVRWRSLAVSPDGSALTAEVHWRGKAAPWKGGTTRVLWDLANGNARWRVENEPGQSTGVAFSHDGNRLVLTSWMTGPTVYDAVSGKVVRHLQLPDRERHHPEADPRNIRDCALVSDGKTLAVASANVGVRLWDVATGKALRLFSPAPRSSFSGSTGYLLTALSPDGRRVALCWGRTVWLWDAATGQPIPSAPAHWNWVTGVQFSPDGKRLLSREWNGGAGPNTVLVWDGATGKHLASSDVNAFDQGKGRLITVSNHHQLCVRRPGNGQGDDGTLVLQETAGGKVVCQLETKDKDASGFGGWISPNDRLVMLRQPKERHALLFDARSGILLSSLSGLSYWEVVFAPDDSRVAWFTEDGVIHVAAVASGKEIYRLREPRKDWNRLVVAPALAFSPNGRYLAAWEVMDNDVILWDLQTGTPYCRIAGQKPTLFFGRSVCLAFSPDGRTLAVGGMAAEADILLYEVATAQLRRRLRGHAQIVNGLAFSPDGRRLASASDDTTVLLWDLLAKSE